MSALAAGVCLALAAASGAAPALPAAPTFVPAREFTLAWTHSIEKTRWEEDYVVVDDTATQSASSARPRLRATAARVRGSGAGMEPPPGATLHGGWYEYTPTTPDLPELLLTRSAYTADYEWCEHGQCRPLGSLLPSDGGVTRLWPCRRGRAATSR